MYYDTIDCWVLCKYSALLVGKMGVFIKRMAGRNESEVWCRNYALCDYSSFTLYAFLHSVITMWRLFEIVRWSDDAITYYPLRLRIP